MTIPESDYYCCLKNISDIILFVIPRLYPYGLQRFGFVQNKFHVSLG